MNSVPRFPVFGTCCFSLIIDVAGNFSESLVLSVNSNERLTDRQTDRDRERKTEGERVTFVSLAPGVSLSIGVVETFD